MKTSVYIFVLLCVGNLYGQSGDPICSIQTTCSKCMEAGPHCVWSAKTDEVRACNIKAAFNESSKNYIYEGPTSETIIIKDDALKDVGEDANDKAIQIKPQQVKLKLRPHDTQKFTMVYRPAENYPLDLYYLMDLSVSMKDDKDTLVGLRNSLPSTLHNLTKHARIGFGSFADKLEMPYANMRDKAVKNPCHIDSRVCAPLYEYKHRLQLTRNFNDFISEVNASEVTGNLDNLEGGLDALVQVLSCRDQIGWIDDSRKIIIYASDGTMHFAGDGKLGGIIKPNDCATCYLDDKGLYNRFKEIDYPTLSGISRALIDKKAFVIFAVTEEVTEEYKRLNQLLKENTFVAIISNDSSNILELVEKGYKKAVSSANFKDDAPSYLNVRYLTNCGKGDGPKVQNGCDEIEVGKEYEFIVEVTLEKCPENKAQWNNLLKIEERLTATNLKVELEYLCGCPCENENEIQYNHEHCNAHGDLACGRCACHTGWDGRDCSCNLSDASSEKILEQRCVKPVEASGNKTNIEDEEWKEIDEYYKVKINAISSDDPDFNISNPLLCSGKGECQCGVCFCADKYTGTYCECKTCDKNCGGSSHGTCDCGKCICRPEWTGELCDCAVSQEPCLTNSDSGEEYCSGNGDCKCGKCICSHDSLGRQCRGEFCQICGDTNEVCEQFLECARCYAESVGRRDRGELCVEECGKHQANETIPKMVDDLEGSEASQICAFQSELSDKTCHYEYVYKNRQKEKKVDLHITSACRDKTNTATMSIYIIIGTLLIGLLGLLLFKFYQWRKDQIEFKNFANEAEFNLKKMDDSHEATNVNQLYKSPITHHEMPAEAFGRVKKVDTGNAFQSNNETKPCEGCRVSSSSYRSSVSSSVITPPSSPFTKDMIMFEGVREVKEEDIKSDDVFK